MSRYVKDGATDNIFAIWFSDMFQVTQLKQMKDPKRVFLDLKVQNSSYVQVFRVWIRVFSDMPPSKHTYQGSSVHDGQSSSGLMPLTGATVAVSDDGEIGVAANICHEPPSEKRKRCPDEVLPRHRSHISSDDGAQIVGQPSDSHTNTVQPPKRTRRRGQPCVNNVATHSSSTTQASATHACSVIRPSTSEATENTVEPQKRSRHRKQSSASDAAHHSPSNIQASALHACSVTEPSGSHVAQNVAQPRKRIRRTPQASTQSTNNITEISTSYASPVNEMANSHATQSSRKPQKRNMRTRQSSTGRGNDHSQNITEGSTSYTPESFSDTSPTYDDLGDCTECCNYCNAAFWRGEQLAGHGYGSHVSHYHLCCGNGKVFMQPEPNPPEYIKQLLGDATFMENIRAYNQMFAMNSFGTTIDSTVNQGRGPYVFKVSDQIYHRIGSLCPTDSPPLDPEVVQGLIHFLDTHNELVQIFRTALDKCDQADVPEFKIRLYSGEGPHGYELPSSNTLDAIVFDRGPESESNYDVVLEYRSGPVKRISKIHKSYMSLQFPLIFIYGQPGFHTKTMEENTQALVQLPCEGSSQAPLAFTDEESAFQMHALILRSQISRNTARDYRLDKPKTFENSNPGEHIPRDQDQDSEKSVV
ncbi:hypothetical protein CTI12_AA202350 [Artemisia annua]|uniref:C2H2-type domain-containing protein n=1 Tax=Artemisia annua TaxID=35608 RepID=A0A2U1P290_ARTAN|nr:hypothetical protein CTI12_AA202350 [Artemisia annua]